MELDQAYVHWRANFGASILEFSSCINREIIGWLICLFVSDLVFHLTRVLL
jgi:hypothetical protein